MNTCKGICCQKYETAELRGPYAAMKYFQGFKRCKVCGLLIKVADKHCPCCKAMLSSKPFSGKGRRHNLILKARLA